MPASEPPAGGKGPGEPTKGTSAKLSDPGEGEAKGATPELSDPGEGDLPSEGSQAPGKGTAAEFSGPSVSGGPTAEVPGKEAEVPGERPAAGEERESDVEPSHMENILLFMPTMLLRPRGICLEVAEASGNLLLM